MEYLGPVTKGINGEQCEYWNNTNIPANLLAYIADINEALYGTHTPYSNQCRFVGKNNVFRSPWCFNKDLQPIACQIEYCGSFYKDT